MFTLIDASSAMFEYDIIDKYVPILITITYDQVSFYPFNPIALLVSAVRLELYFSTDI